MFNQSFNAPRTASEILGDLTALAEQLGSADGLCQLPIPGALLEAGRIESVAALQGFLDVYASKVLIGHELPAIARAYGHMTRYEIRELIAFDGELEPAFVQHGFADASRSVGRAQLYRLRPLRGERAVQRYWGAVENDNANAWHTLVYGLVLALYSLPLRQGLLHFAEETLAGFVRAAGRRLPLTVADRDALMVGRSRLAASAIEEVLTPSQSPLS